MRLGLPEIIVILALALLFFGPSRLPQLGKSLGEALNGFKKALHSADPEEKPLPAARADGQSAEQKTAAPPSKV